MSNYVIKSFELEYGKVLENINVEYNISGTPQYNEEGYITNAVIYCPTYRGNISVLKGAHSYLKKEASFDDHEFFFITITSFGSPESYSPSTSKLRYEFPQYSIKDMVNFKRQFLAENFKIKKLRGIVGEEIGGYEIFTWATEYPDEMDFILILNSDFKISGYRLIISKGFEAIVDSIEEYYSPQYSVSLSKAIVAINTFLFAQSSTEKIFSTLSSDEIEVLLDDFIDEGLSIDIYDFNIRNSAILNYNVEDKLSDIKAKTLVIYSNDSVYFDQPLDVDVLKSEIQNLTVLSYESKKESYFDEEDYSLIGKEVIEFLEKSRKD